MQISSATFCSSKTIFLHPSFSREFRPLSVFPDKPNDFGPNLSVFSNSSRVRPHSHFLTQSTAIQEPVETSSYSSHFVETGYIYGVHGLQGEVRVKLSTDFPELRFSKPGTRWLKQQVSGTDTIYEIDLVEGRGYPGQSWIVRFNDINTVEQAQRLVGSTIVVRDEDRPVLEEGEFYTQDLVGMAVSLKESGEQVGTVVKVFNCGASDLLHVKLNSLRKISDQIENSKVEAGDSGPLVWIPFVEAIVPIVDLEKREMLITPPKGLLELNVRSDERSKKERRELEWKERKKFQRRLIAAKKKLHEMEQEHVFHGFRYGEKDQRSLLANQIVTVNSKLLQQALENIKIPPTRLTLLQTLSAVPRSNTIKISDIPSSSGTGLLSEPYHKLKMNGSALASVGKVAMVLLLEEIEEIIKTKGSENAPLLLKALLDDHLKFIKIEERSTVPLLLVTSTSSVNSLQDLFLDHDYFAFDPQKVWFLEEEKLPVVSNPVEEHGKHKILMKSPWEFLQKPVGSGGLISLLSSQDSLVDELSELGVEYIEVCKTNKKHEDGHGLVGLVDSCKANVGLHLFKDITSDEDVDVVFSMSFLRKLMKQPNNLQFEAIVGCNPYVEKVDKEWIDVNPSAPNSVEFRSSIYCCCLNASPANKICMFDPTN